MPDDKKVRVKLKINPRIAAEHKREQKEGYEGTVEDYYEEFYGPIPEGFEKGGKVKMHKMPNGKMMKDSDMKKNKKMGGGMMQDSMGYKKGGTVRGGRSEIKGTRPAKLY